MHAFSGTRTPTIRRGAMSVWAAHDLDAGPGRRWIKRSLRRQVRHQLAQEDAWFGW